MAVVDERSEATGGGGTAGSAGGAGDNVPRGIDERSEATGAGNEAEAPAPAVVTPTDRLFIPNRKRLSHTYVTSSAGVRELHIDYGLQEIVFDDERFFAFGEHVVREPCFTGAQATTWGAGYAWDEVQPLLEALVDSGILKVGDGVDDPRGGGLVPSMLPPSVCPVARSWSGADCEAITRDLAGRAVEVGNLEVVVPVFKIAHPALDADDRQVGEGNVFPPRLRLDRETEWRVCQYAGSRYRDDAPMNVTALRAMIKHWKPMMATLLEVRAALRARLGPTPGPWTIGELHTLAVAVLALPGYQLMKRGGTSPQPPLHPVLSSLFRITDGIRMTTFEMTFVISHTRRVDEPMTAAELYAHAERHGVLIGATGVCAGPKPLIDEFLATAIDGAPADGIAGLALPDEVRALLDELPAAMDYAMYGLQSWALSLSVWLAMSRAYEPLLAFCAAATPTSDATEHAALLDQLRADWAILVHLQITLPYDRGVHHGGYADAYAQARRALRAPIGAATLDAELAPAAATADHAAAEAALRALFDARFAPGEGRPSSAPLCAALVDYLREEQAILAATARRQDAINALLARTPARRELRVRDFLVHYSIGSGLGSFPYLFDTLERELGIRVQCSAASIEVIDKRAS